MITRRKLLLGALVPLGILGLGAWTLGRRSAESAVRAIVHQRLSFLQLDEPGLRAFAAAQVDAWSAKRLPSLHRLTYHFRSAFSQSFQRFDRSVHRSGAATLEDAIVSTYLLSSDFFPNGSNEANPVRFVAFYDPLRPCTGNPFFRSAVGAS